MMKGRFLRVGRILSAWILFLSIPGSVFSQEEEWDDTLFMEGEGITVTESTETTQHMRVISKEEIEKQNTHDLATLLQETLDMGITSYGAYGNQTNINMRGFDSNRIAFLIDGVPANSLVAGGFDLSQIDPSSIDKIEVIYGGSDSKYNVSGALGGVINIITVKKEKPGLRLGGSISNTSAMPGKYRKQDGNVEKPHYEDLLDSQNYSLFGSYGAEKYSVTANIFTNRAANHFLFKDENFDTVRRKEGNEVFDTGGGLSYSRNLPDYSTIIASGDIYYGDKNIPKSGVGSSSDLIGKQTDFSTRQKLLLDMPRVFHDNFATEASLSHSWKTLDYAPSIDGSSSSLHDEHLIMGINRWTWYPGEKLTLMMGADYQYAFLNSTEFNFHDRHDGGIYLTAEFQPLEQFLIIPSVKGVFSGPQTSMPAVAVPKLGLLWNISDSLRLKNNYFRSFKQPDFQDLYWSGGGMNGNPDLKPEDGWGGDLGVLYAYKEFLNIETTMYTQWTEDSIHWAPFVGTTWRPENVGEAMYFGNDTRVKYVMPLSKGVFQTVGISLSYQYLLSYLLSYGFTWASDKRIPYMPMHTVGASLEFTWKTGSLQLSGHYEALRYSDRDNSAPMDPYFLLNINVNQKINNYLSSFLALRNLLNTFYESKESYPVPGFTATIGMRINIEPGKEKKSE
ncbi:putative vitamin B12 transporter BtuB (Cobalamin receptor) (Outermembrane cobalamin translocator) [Treponema primitia ZAS-2]|uniref:Putative vitamin B12 transporter BtuB (Cobalamin receptor) (Outermembrane cobalamin translocator) n=1 Tax=Treponema primitia (strain ATCC BAA-887 / DSM 12427 / ZAS-2) TaxID=545694 RepID=F5YLA6_TREPZ|nr:TonB-dependent receptor [Treponema primitia]AEF85224.1 putative vitamin B12 transporter BtuB (Cobalamin receptor) (Outermembrane cobalamin translocator) [Treponema primitia ZAS-2]